MKINTTKNLLLAATIVTILNYSNCKKYEDGPKFSLKTKKTRLTGEWEVVYINGESPDNDAELIMEFEKDGDFVMSYEYDYGTYSYSYSYKGEWEWKDDKERIEIDVNNTKIEFEILRLTNDELWFEDEDGQEWELEKL